MKFHPEIFAVVGGGSIAARIYCGLAACLIIGGVLFIHLNHKTKRRRTRARIPPPAIKNKIRLNGASHNPSSGATKGSTLDGYAWPKPAFKPFRRKRRKRIFDYSKFYASVMKELSLHSYNPVNAAREKPHANGQTASNISHANQAIKSEIDNLIAGQQILIQKQKSLLEEQARLIEEKNRIIEEQTAFLKNRFGQAADRSAAA